MSKHQDERKQHGPVWWTVTVILVMALYLVSFGPVWWAVSFLRDVPPNPLTDLILAAGLMYSIPAEQFFRGLGMSREFYAYMHWWVPHRPGEWL